MDPKCGDTGVHFYVELLRCQISVNLL